MRVYFLGCLLVLFISCKQKEMKVIEYKYLVADIWNPNVIKERQLAQRTLIKGDSLSIYNKDNVLKKVFKFTTNSKGIYIDDKGKRKLLYPFGDNVKMIRDSSIVDRFYEEVELVGKKTYIVNDVEYQIYHFLESGGDQTLDSYFLVGEGFICFYEFKGSEFFYLDSPKASEVYKIFTEDYSFNAVLEVEMARIQLSKQSELDL